MTPRHAIRRHTANAVSLLALTAAMLVGATSAWGQASAPAAAAAPAAEVGEVIVTATRREENLKNVPESASVLSGQALAVIGTAGQDIRQLAFTVPSLNIESSNGRTFPDSISAVMATPTSTASPPSPCRWCMTISSRKTRP